VDSDFWAKKDVPSVLFNNYQSCIYAAYAKNNENSRRKIQRKTPGWRYAHFNEMIRENYGGFLILFNPVK
jgi:hypothetical protein